MLELEKTNICFINLWYQKQIPQASFDGAYIHE